MRNPKRLDNFYLTLKNIHQENFPDWRFGQFMSNFNIWYANKGLDLFFLEEDDFISQIYEFKEAMKNNER